MAPYLRVVINVLATFLGLSLAVMSASGAVNAKILDHYANKSTPNFQCFQAKETNRWLRLWSSLNVKVENIGQSQAKITIVCGANETDVKEQLSQSSIILLPSFLPPWMHSTKRSMSPLANNCIGVDAAGNENVNIIVTETFVNEIYFLLTLIGVLLYLSAPRLSKSVVFHYSTGITLGVLASLLVLVYILSRFIPRKTGAISLLLGGWALCLYFLRWVLDNFFSMQYKTYLIGYFVVAAVLSFAVCYWYGPVTNDRTMYLIQLFLQLVGLVCVYNGSQHEGSTVAIVVVLVTVRWVPFGSALRWVLSRLRRPKPPPKTKLLTADEYFEQGQVETQKALDSLREYCRSHECDQWKMVANLESPKRFAQFVNGHDHVTPFELSTYEDDLSLLTLDTDSDSDRMSSDVDMETD